MTPGVVWLAVALVVAGTVWRVCVAWERTHHAPGPAPRSTEVPELGLEPRPDLADPEPDGRVTLHAYNASAALERSCCPTGFRSLGRVHDITCRTSPPELGSAEARGIGVPCCQTGGLIDGDRHDNTCLGGAA